MAIGALKRVLSLCAWQILFSRSIFVCVSRPFKGLYAEGLTPGRLDSRCSHTPTAGCQEVSDVHGRNGWELLASFLEGSTLVMVFLGLSALPSGILNSAEARAAK